MAELSTDEPVTVTVARNVAFDREADFSSWAEAMIADAGHCEGYLGGGVLAPGVAGEPWHMVYRFASAASFEAWQRSPERARRLAAADSLMSQAAERRFTGLETWFAVPGRDPDPPARWKMATVTAVVALPISYLVNLVLAPALRVPSALRPLLSIAVLVTWLTWVAMPRVTVALDGWLRPDPSH